MRGFWWANNKTNKNLQMFEDLRFRVWRASIAFIRYFDYLYSTSASIFVDCRVVVRWRSLYFSLVLSCSRRTPILIMNFYFSNWDLELVLVHNTVFYGIKTLYYSYFETEEISLIFYINLTKPTIQKNAHVFWCRGR